MVSPIWGKDFQNLSKIWEFFDNDKPDGRRFFDIRYSPDRIRMLEAEDSLTLKLVVEWGLFRVLGRIRSKGIIYSLRYSAYILR